MSKTVIPVATARPGTRDPGAPARPFFRPARRHAAGGGVRDLRISVTDRCNFRCTYCMPKEVFGADYQFLPHAELLTFEEIARLARVFRGLGVEKIRLTGGEPLLRRGHRAADRHAARHMPGVDLTLTTNGSLLAHKAPRAARRRPEARHRSAWIRSTTPTFRAMNDVDFPVAKVLDGIDAAAAAGLAPIKVNMVVKRGVNDDQIVAMARHFSGSGHIVRFIEFMDVGATNGWRMDDVVPCARDRARASTPSMPLEPVDPQLPRRSRRALALPRRRGRDRRHLLGDRRPSAATARARASPPTASSTPACSPTEGHDLRALLRGGADDEEHRRARSPPSGSARADRYSEIRTAETARAAQGRDVLHRRLSRHAPSARTLTRAARPATFIVDAHQRDGRARAHAHRRRASADALPGQARNRHADDAGRRARGARASATCATSGWCIRIDDIVAVQVDWESDAVAVTTRERARRTSTSAWRKRTVTTGCGQGTVFGDLMEDIDSIRLPRRRARSTEDTLYALLDNVRRHESIYKAGRRRARLRAGAQAARRSSPSSRTSAATTRWTRSPAGCGWRASTAATRSSTPPAG